MKTPEEIKKGILCDGPCNDCPYKGRIMSDGGCGQAVVDDTVAYIQQLERERDAAVEDLRTMGEHAPCCETCFYNATSEDEEPCKYCYAGYIENHWQWRGVQEVE